jgi:competence protein ComEA
MAGRPFLVFSCTLLFSGDIMLKKLLVVLGGLLFAAFAWAVDVNTATQAELESVKGIGTATAAAIIAERNKGGPFKSTQDLADRVNGIGEKNVEKFKAEGLTVGAAPAPAKPAGTIADVKQEVKKAIKDAPVQAKAVGRWARQEVKKTGAAIKQGATNLKNEVKSGVNSETNKTEENKEPADK